MRTIPHATARFIAAALLLIGFALPAAAQVEPIDPVWMVATRETPIRCGELSTFYKVADLERGQLVRVDGRSTRFARVIYPDDLFGFVRAEDAKDVKDGTLTVGQISDIKAPNQISGLTGSWRSIYLGELKPGTRLTILGEAKSKDGQMVGYRVKPLLPPAVDHPPHGFVQLVALREATQDEIDAHLAASKPEANKPAAAEETPAEQDTPAEPAPESDDTGASTEEPTAGDATPPADEAATNDTSESDTPASPEADPGQPADNSLVEDMAIPTPEELTETPPADQPAGDQSGDAPAGDGETAQPATPEIPPQRREYLQYEELESTLTRVRRMGGKTLEDSLDELIAEYERSLANTDTPAIRQAVSNRLEWLRLRKAARDQRLALQAALADAKERRADIRRQQDIWRSSLGYDIVGRLIPSAIYDGENLPRMYRIVAAGEGGLTRTIGYVRDEPGMDLGSLVGDIVGVAGNARLDDALRLRVITPTRIERFQPVGTPAP